MRWAEAHPALDTYARDVLRQLLFKFQGGAQGQCWPKLETLAEACGFSVSTVKRRLVVLASAGVGLIERTRRAVLVDAKAGWRGASRWCQTSTLHRIIMPTCPPPGAVANPSHRLTPCLSDAVRPSSALTKGLKGWLSKLSAPGRSAPAHSEALAEPQTTKIFKPKPVVAAWSSPKWLEKEACEAAREEQRRREAQDRVRRIAEARALASTGTAG